MRAAVAFLLLTTSALGCEANTRDLVVSRAIPSADGNWIWIDQVDQQDTPPVAGADASTDAGADAGTDAGGLSGVQVPGDAWIARISGEREVRWQLGVGTMGTLETAEAVVELADDRIAVVGAAGGDASLFLLEARGAFSLQKTLGGAGEQGFVELTTLQNGDVVAVGDGTNAAGEPGVLAARFTNAGALVWQRFAAMPDADEVFAVNVMLRADGRLIFVGAVDRPSQMRGLDIWAAATDLDGNLEWQRTVGTTLDDAPAHAAITEDLGLIVASRVTPTEPPPDPMTPITGDVWVLRADRGGSVVWQRYFEKVNFDEAPTRIAIREDGRIHVAATADGFGSRNLGDTDLFLLELSPAGELLSQRNLATLSPDRPVNLFEADTRSIIITGVVDERPAYWTLDDNGGLVDGCAVVTETDARIIDTSVQTFEGAAMWADPGFTLADSMMSEGRPPPIQALECRLSR